MRADRIEEAAGAPEHAHHSHVGVGEVASPGTPPAIRSLRSCSLYNLNDELSQNGTGPIRWKTRVEEAKATPRLAVKNAEAGSKGRL